MPARKPPSAVRPQLYSAPSASVLPTVVAATCKIRKTKWLVPGLLPRGAVCTLEGRKGLGKSHLCAALAAIITGGPPYPGCRRKRHGAVLWANGEESLEEDLIPKLREGGADLKSVRVLTKGEGSSRRRALTLPDEMADLRHTIEQANVALTILDPLRSFLSSALNTSDEKEMGDILESLKDLAEETSSCVLLVRHRRKSQHGPTVDAGMGSVAIAAVARIVLGIDPAEDRKSGSILRPVAQNKGLRVPARHFYIVGTEGGSKLQWGSVVDSEDEEGVPFADDPGAALEGRTALDLVLSELAQGPRRAKDVQSAAECERISKAAVWRAAKRLGVQIKRIGFGSEGYFEWTLAPQKSALSRK